MTKQMETDTTTEEREILLQRAGEALTLGHRHDLEAVRDQLKEHHHMYEGDEALPLVEQTIAKLEAALADNTPDSVNYGTAANQ